MPFLTINKASETAKAGDTVILREGIYREILTPQNSGTASNPIVFKAYEGEKAVISATEVVEGFKDYGNGIAIQSISWDLGNGRNQVFLNGEALPEARYPNGPGIEMSEDAEPLSKLFPVVGDFKTFHGDKSIVYSQTLLDQEQDNYWKGGTFVSLHGMGWALGTAEIASSSKGRLDLGKTSTRWWFDASSTSKWSFGFISGHINCLDEPGEWLIKNGNLLVVLPERETHETLSVEVKKRQLVIDLTDRKHIVIDGISTIGGGVTMNNSEMCVINHADMKYIGHFVYSEDQREGFIEDGNTLNPNGPPLRGEMGIYLGGTDNMVMNSVIDHSAGAGIYGTGVYQYIENNIIKNCGYAGSYVSGITFATETWKPLNTPRGGFAIYNNTVYNCGRSTFNMQSGSYKGAPGTPILPFEIAYNDFHDGILFSLDTGLTYEYYVSCETDKLQSKYHHNYVYYTSKETNPYSFGIYHDNYTHGIDTFNNVVFTTQPGVTYSQSYVFKQPDSISFMWNNRALLTAVKGGPSGLTVEDFPYGKPFYAGAMLDAPVYIKNYDIITKGQSSRYYTASDAILHGGAFVDDDFLVNFTENGQWIEFKDVDFGTDGNQINIDFKGDKYHTNDSITIIIGDSIDSGETYNARLESTAQNIRQNNTLSQNVMIKEGITNVYIRMDAYRSARIDRISISNRGVSQSSHDGKKIYGGAFNNVDRVGNLALPPGVKYASGENGTYPLVNNTWPGTVLRYLQLSNICYINLKNYWQNNLP